MLLPSDKEFLCPLGIKKKIVERAMQKLVMFVWKELPMRPIKEHKFRCERMTLSLFKFNARAISSCSE